MKSTPVSIPFANICRSDPNCLPIPGQAPVFGVVAPKWADDGTCYLMPDGTEWVYRGISAYKCDDMTRINGWEKLEGHEKEEGK